MKQNQKQTLHTPPPPPSKGGSWHPNKTKAEPKKSRRVVEWRRNRQSRGRAEQGAMAEQALGEAGMTWAGSGAADGVTWAGFGAADGVMWAGPGTAGMTIAGLGAAGVTQTLIIGSTIRYPEPTHHTPSHTTCHALHFNTVLPDYTGLHAHTALTHLLSLDNIQKHIHDTFAQLSVAQPICCKCIICYTFTLLLCIDYIMYR